MDNLANFITEALNLTPEQKKHRAALKQKRKEWLAKGKDVSIIDKELEAMTGASTVKVQPKKVADPTLSACAPIIKKCVGNYWTGNYDDSFEYSNGALYIRDYGKAYGDGWSSYFYKDRDTLGQLSFELDGRYLQSVDFLALCDELFAAYPQVKSISLTIDRD